MKVWVDYFEGCGRCFPGVHFLYEDWRWAFQLLHQENLHNDTVRSRLLGRTVLYPSTYFEHHPAHLASAPS